MQEVAHEQALKPWDRRPDEPELWFERFRRWLELSQKGGPRSVLLIYKQERDGDVHRNKSRVRVDAGRLIRAIPAGWRAAVILYDWARRAEAHDEEQFRRGEELQRRRRELQEKLEEGRELFRLPSPSKKRRSNQERIAATIATAAHLLASYREEEEKLRARARRMMKKKLEKARKGSEKKACTGPKSPKTPDKKACKRTKRNEQVGFDPGEERTRPLIYCQKYKSAVSESRRKHERDSRSEPGN